METRVSRLLGTKYPVIQGGMAWVAEYHLAAADYLNFVPLRVL